MSNQQETTSGAKAPGKWRRVLRRCVLLACATLIVGAAAFAFLARNHIRSIWSIQRIPDTDMYVMDYYGTYNLEQIAQSGTDSEDIEGSLIRALLPDVLVPVAEMISGHKKGQRDWRQSDHSCSTVSFCTDNRHVYFGRNFDWAHDPCLIARIHGTTSSVAVLDLHYLNLNRAKLNDLSIKDRLNLLFAPYLAQDGMNEYGVAVSSMAAKESESWFDDQKPSVVKPVMKRLILDYARTTDEAVELLQSYNIDFDGLPCHFMITDASGKSVVVEYVDGKTEVLSSDKPWQVSTNHVLFGSTESVNRDMCPRYKTASESLARADSEIGPNEIMGVMSSISVPDWTMWSSVYDLTTGDYQIAYRRRYDNVFKDRLGVRQPNTSARGPNSSAIGVPPPQEAVVRWSSCQ